MQAAIGPAPRNVRLPEVVEERREPHLEWSARVRGRLNDFEGVLVDCQVVVATFLVEADRALELGEERDEHPGVASDSQRLRRLLAEQQLRELAHPVRGESAPDALSRDE